MKKVLVFILACLASTAMYSQTKAGEHYQVVSQGCLGTNCYMRFCLYINGELVNNPNLEVGVFDQDDICRGTKKPQLVPMFGWYYYNITCKGYEGCEYHFKVWDHDANAELTDLTLDYDFENDGDYEFTEFVYASLFSYGSGTDPLHLNFARPVEGYTLHIDGYADNENPDGGYYLIAIPVQSAVPAEIEGMTEEAYDLFYFDETQDKEWINYKAGEGVVSVDPGFSLESGKGYLYAHDTDVDLYFTGTPVEGDEVTVELTKGGNGAYAGWNLVGNPFADAEAYITKAFYTMNDAGDGYVSNVAGVAIAPMTGIFVEAGEDGESLTFSKTAGSKTMKLALNLVQNSSVVDRAIVTFGAGQQLPKFQLRSSSTKLYIPMDGEDFAVVSSAEMGEMPVNFKAEKSGSYTLAVSTEVSFNYLHLIDNLTGVDQDLLANPSYSFEASTTDYASRFRLVFATGNSDDTFAFYSNGSFVISNEGEATVQVVDVTGRMLSSETINGSASVSVDGAAGVYMIRLVNGESVKVQKVVVK